LPKGLAAASILNHDLVGFPQPFESEHSPLEIRIVQALTKDLKQPPLLVQKPPNVRLLEAVPVVIKGGEVIIDRREASPSGN
jgi:hypothetical protein